MTAEQFEQSFAEHSGITVEQLRELGRVVRPCNCGVEWCEGWQSLSLEAAREYDAQGSP